MHAVYIYKGVTSAYVHTHVHRGAEGYKDSRLGLGSRMYRGYLG